MKKTILLSVTLILLCACETGAKNKEKIKEPLLSGIVERTDTPITHKTYMKKVSKTSSNKIFSNSAQPGYYLQMAVFAKNRPSKSFLQPLTQSNFDYIVLNKSSKNHVLIGPYFSYNSAKDKVSTVKKNLGKQTFVVQVLRP